jgi:RHS repeat-associated protein
MAVCEERDATGTNVTKRFFAQGQVNFGTNLFYTRDHLGSVRELTDSTGAIHARYDYDPYGRLTKVQGDLDADFTFTGHFYHHPSGLYLTMYRAHEPNVGRWLSRDPMAERSGLNLYAYARNNPINYSDPYGLLSPNPAPITQLLSAPTMTEVSAEVSGLTVSEALVLAALALAGGYLIGSVIDIGRDAELSPTGVNGPPATVTVPLPDPLPLPAPQTEPAPLTPEPPEDTDDCPPDYVFYHYTDNPNLEGLGLNFNSWVTSTPGLSWDQALLITTGIEGSPDTIYQYPVTIGPETPMNFEGRVNGVYQWQLPIGSPLGSIGTPVPIPKPTNLP